MNCFICKKDLVKTQQEKIGFAVQSFDRKLMRVYCKKCFFDNNRGKIAGKTDTNLVCPVCHNHCRVSSHSFAVKWVEILGMKTSDWEKLHIQDGWIFL